ncbi:MAG: hypothetical protein EAZ19_01275, partial [Oscillatoriales cyanobacterium]
MIPRFLVTKPKIFRNTKLKNVSFINRFDRHSKLIFSDYQLPITNYQLPITNYQLPITNYQLPITNYQLP